jgi:NAD(P)-dependent dehydrogenase (short-subunit alcohol dehydrogenase family)
MTDGDAAHLFVQDVVERFGGVGITNAGGPTAKDFLSLELEEWRAAVELSFLRVVRLARESSPQMQRRHWSRIISITSTSVRQAVRGLVLSSTSSGEASIWPLIHLLRAGVDINTIRAWLGRVSLDTTNIMRKQTWLLKQKRWRPATQEVGIAKSRRGGEMIRA